MDARSSQPNSAAQASVNMSQENEGEESSEDMLVRLFNQHYASLVRLASFLLDDLASCEEVVQDAFVKMQITKSRPEQGKEPAYLRSIVMNGARSKMRRRLVRKRVFLAERPAVAPSLENEVIDASENRRILALLRQLPRRQAEVLTLRFYMDLSEEEIAKTLKISKGSVKTHASRGLDKMAELLNTENKNHRAKSARNKKTSSKTNKGTNSEINSRDSAEK